MTEDILKMARESIAESEKELRSAEDLAKRLKAAGEDTVELQRKIAEAKRRLQRFKKAFA